MIFRPHFGIPHGALYGGSGGGGGEDITSGLVAHYPCDEGAGTAVADASGNGNNVTLNGSPAWISGPGSFGAISFNNSGYGTVADQSPFLLSSGMTTAGWFCGQGAWVNHGPWFGMVNHYGGWLGYWIGIHGQSIVRVGATEHQREYTGFPNDSSTWFWAAVTFDGAQVRWYQNGVELGSPASASGTLNYDVGVYFCFGGRSGDEAGIKVSQLRIYDRALTPEQIQALYDY